MLEEIKKTLVPPYDTKDLFSIFLALFLMLSIPLTVIQVTNIRDSRSQASNASQTSPLRVTFTTPSEEKTVEGIVNVVIEAFDSSNEVKNISLIVDGSLISTNNNPNSSNNFSTSFAWDSTKGANGKKTLQAQAENSQNQKQLSSKLDLFVVNNDTVPPSVSFVQPDDGSYISGSTYWIKINANDNQALAKVTLEIDGKAIKQFRKIPYEYLWNISDEKAGNHTLKAVATDYSGNETSTTISIYKGTKNLNN